MGDLGKSGYQMSDELRAALQRAKDHVMTPEEIFEQRVSFVYGQQDHDNPNPFSKDEIREKLIASQGRPPCLVCAARPAAPGIEEMVRTAVWNVCKGRGMGDEPAMAVVNGVVAEIERLAGSGVMEGG